MIQVNSLVRLKVRLPEDLRANDIGIVTHISGNLGNETVTVLWPLGGTEEKWSITGLEVING